MRKIHWILQQNVINQTTLRQVKEGLRANNVSFEELKIIPFSNDLPNIKDSEDFKVFYGSTTLILNAYANEKYSEGIFYNRVVK